ncbi:hypothetical protein [Mycoplasma sp. HS2188]|uniref:hypothetical protein n=1 Tax=Mycoplasma sp. HS2188 TaxID=2976765 RepID=UPI0021AA933C|nr:hypothetical protein [Mycoplasma sp. HS2188]MCT4470043.1 hypothetical protein [Mycoplasma sp. HS2188]
MEGSFVIAGIEFLAIVLILMIVVLVRGYKECFARDKKLRQKARSNQKEWKYLVSGVVVSVLGIWTMVTYFIVK